MQSRLWAGAALEAGHGALSSAEEREALRFRRACVGGQCASLFALESAFLVGSFCELVVGGLGRGRGGVACVPWLAA